MFKLKTLLFFIVLAMAFTKLNAQPPGMSPDEMMAREKQALYTKITDLTDDQKILIEGIYDEFGKTIKQTFQEMRESNNREGMREKMTALRKEKDDLMADVLNEKQYVIYTEVTARKDRKRPEDAPQPIN
jgi:hypothetical protein